MAVLSTSINLSVSKILVGIVLYLIVSVVTRALYRAYVTPLRDVPGPWLARYSRLWQLYAVWSRDFEKRNIQLHRSYGPIARIGPNEYSIDDPEAAKAIYRQRNQLLKSARYSAWGMPGQELNLFAEPDVSRHDKRLRQVASMYQMSTVIGMEENVDRVTARFCERMKTFAQSRQQFDMTIWVYYYAFDVIADLAYGKAFGLLDKGQDFCGLTKAVHTFSRYGALVGVYNEWHAFIFRMNQLFTASKGEQQGLAYILEFGRQLLANQVRQGESLKSRGDFMSLMYDMHVQDPVAFTIDDILFHTLGNVGGGSDTIAIGLNAAMYFLFQNPGTLRKLREELDERFKDKPSDVMVSYREAQECPYLQAVIKETLRINPSIGLTFPRVVPKDGMMLAGRFFPEGSLVGVNPYVAHANRDVFGPDIESFRPERWLQGPTASARMEQYTFTFGRGPRTCIGKNIAMMELSKLISEFVVRFDLTLVDPSQGLHAGNDWLMFQKDFWVVVSERERKASL